MLRLRPAQLRDCQLPPSVRPLSSVRRQDVCPKHTRSEAQGGHQPVEKLPDPDGAGELGMALVPLPHPDSTVPREERPVLAGPGGGGPLRPIRLKSVETHLKYINVSLASDRPARPATPNCVTGQALSTPLVHAQQVMTEIHVHL